MRGQSLEMMGGDGMMFCESLPDPDGAEIVRLTAFYRPYYKKAERFCPPDHSAVPKHRLMHDPSSLGTEGPLAVSYPQDFSPSHRLWHNTLSCLNVETNEAHLSGSNVGAWTSITAVDPKTQVRSYAAPAYYLPNSGRSNLVLCTGASVSKIILDDTKSGLIAKGVRFQQRGKEYTATVLEEVIVCAGSVASPQLLELSGIGNPSILQAAGIPVKVTNLNVGEHLQDHISE
jgi:choline dehydrogenase-like flavoprotein